MRVNSLTSLRFFAALFVVFFHFLPLWFPAAFEGRDGNLVKSAITMGYLGVPFFFLLSGYVLTLGYAKNLVAGNLQCLVFWRRRLYRLTPILLISLLLGFFPLVGGLLKEGRGQGFAALSFFTNALYLGAWFPSTLRINYPAWSLSVEAFFYLLFPFVAPFFFRGRFGSRFGDLFFLFAGSFLLPAIAVFYYPSLLSLASNHAELWSRVEIPEYLKQALEINPLLHLCTFLSGMGLARWQAAHPARGRGTWCAALGMGVLVLLVWQAPRIPYLLMHTGLSIPLFALLVLGAAESPLIRRALEPRPLVLLGESSFALYMIHVPLRDWFAFAWNRLAHPPAWAHELWAVFTILFCLMGSIYLFRYVELPIVNRAK